MGWDSNRREGVSDPVTLIEWPGRLRTMYHAKMRRRLERPPKRIFACGVYLLLIPQLLVLLRLLVIMAISIANGGSYWNITESFWVNPESGTALWRDAIIVLVLVLVYSFSIASITRRLLRSRHQRRAIRHNRCPTCGYDIRASKYRCPECGNPFCAD